MIAARISALKFCVTPGVSPATEFEKDAGAEFAAFSVAVLARTWASIRLLVGDWVCDGFCVVAAVAAAGCVVEPPAVAAASVADACVAPAMVDAAFAEFRGRAWLLSETSGAAPFAEPDAARAAAVLAVSSALACCAVRAD